MDTSRDSYGQIFRRVRLEAASRLASDAFETLDGAAKKIGISTNMLKALESGERRPSFETLQAMAKAYNVLEGDLLPSSAPTGPEVAKIIGPLATLPNGTRGRFITQMAAFATILSTEMNAMREVFSVPAQEYVGMPNSVSSVSVQNPIDLTARPQDTNRPRTIGAPPLEEGQPGGRDALPARRHSQQAPSTKGSKGGHRP